MMIMLLAFGLVGVVVMWSDDGEYDWHVFCVQLVTVTDDRAGDGAAVLTRFGTLSSFS